MENRFYDKIILSWESANRERRKSRIFASLARDILIGGKRSTSIEKNSDNKITWKNRFYDKMILYWESAKESANRERRKSRIFASLAKEILIGGKRSTSIEKKL